MTGPVERVPLTDEQLAAIEQRASGAPLSTAAELIGVDLPELIAELRASRAREAELAAERERYEEDRCDLVNDCARAEVERDSARAELSVLRPALREAEGRIDNALARIDRAEPRQHRRVAVMRDIRAVLTGTEDTRGA